ncbi:sigma-B regulation protein RsbQ [Janthinobacterium sp. 67]|uniref:alpha/beta fold hydrolase n=1 Tax=Janthinobacterium sp. 67 TaxID=2035207 RepID=UPI000C23D94E|nr:alpha/beta hydrolase [Janthinobacterium sp. 67]PJJ17585.1 sigma-B regulation protein RsbQ [Janthinobacterium sp. 67]
MHIEDRNNVRVSERSGASTADAAATMVFMHGFGCDQTMWRYLEPLFRPHYRTVLFDLVGSGASDLGAYDFDRYARLDAHGADLCRVIHAVGGGPVICVGHSVSAMSALLATIAEPDLFAAQVMLAPSPCYVDDAAAGYRGGFSRADIDDLLDAMDANYLGWSAGMAPAIMGAPGQPALGDELVNSFCRTDPAIARHFAQATFLSDHRAVLPRNSTPALIVQCSDDFIAPPSVGEYLREMLPRSSLHVVENVGHCPHMSVPDASYRAIRRFLDGLHL